MLHPSKFTPEQKKKIKESNDVINGLIEHYITLSKGLQKEVDNCHLLGKTPCMHTLKRHTDKLKSWIDFIHDFADENQDYKKLGIDK